MIGNTAAEAQIQVQAQANPTAQQFTNGNFWTVLAEAVIKAVASHHSMSEQLLQNQKVFDDVAEALLPEIYDRARLQTSASVQA